VTSRHPFGFDSPLSTQQARADLLDELCGDHGCHSVRVPVRVQLDDIGADQVPFKTTDQRDYFAGRKTSGFEMRHAWRKSRIECIEIQGKIHGSVKAEPKGGGPVAHFHDLNNEAFGLFFLMGVQGADTDLNQAFDLARLHDPGKGATVAELSN